jgi:hypothetical protein
MSNSTVKNESSSAEDSGKFTPYTPPAIRTHVIWSDEEKEIFAEMVKKAEEEGLEMEPVFAAISEKIGRTPKAVSVRYFNQKSKSNRQHRESIDDSTIDGLLSKLKSTVRESKSIINYKQRFEELKVEYDKLSRDQEKLVNTLRRIVGGDAE